MLASGETLPLDLPWEEALCLLGGANRPSGHRASHSRTRCPHGPWSAVDMRNPEVLPCTLLAPHPFKLLRALGSAPTLAFPVLPSRAGFKHTQVLAWDTRPPWPSSQDPHVFLWAGSLRLPSFLFFFSIFIYLL